MLPWFDRQFPLYLAPMAGVTDSIFRALCKEMGADVVVTEFVSAEGIFRKNERTMKYLEFEERERPLGVQMFGADPEHMAEAARLVMEWKRPDFIDINFGCPVSKVVAKNGGSSLLRNCPLLARVARTIVEAIAPVPVTAKIRIGWDRDTVNAVQTARILEDCGIRTIAVHGRTKEQGYTGEADWNVIGEVADAVKIPVIGNGDLTTAQEVQRRKETTNVAGVMIGRGAMSAPWLFREVKQFLATGELVPTPTLAEQWAFIRRHCELVVAREGSELHALSAMRSRLMAYSRGMNEARRLREQFAHIGSLMQLDEIAANHIARQTVEVA